MKRESAHSFAPHLLPAHQPIASLRTYYRLTKPGIVYGNCLTAAAGFFLAAKVQPDFWVFAAMLIGIALVMASACVFNNYIDRRIDAVMARTRKRALAAGNVSVQSALLFGVILGAIGLLSLAVGTNSLTVIIAFVGMIIYIALYGYWKRRSVYGTVVGSLAGAVPPVVGYCAVTSRFDAGALLLLLILALWQMPHFYAIAMFRHDDYKAAGIPVLPVVHGMKAAKIHILSYIAAFTAAVWAFSIAGYTGYIFAAVMTVVGLMWFGVGLRRFTNKEDAKWARTMFSTSLLVLLALSVMLAVGGILP
jgi:heme o synthase